MSGIIFDLDDEVADALRDGWRIESETPSRTVLVKGDSKKEKAEKRKDSGTNHILHLLISVFTLGAWLPIWLLISMWSTFSRRTSGVLASGEERRILVVRDGIISEL